MTGQARAIPIAIIVCAARNGTIGQNGKMPWRMPSDLKHLKATTMGKPVVMGRKTYQSIGKALPGRTNIVVTRQPGFVLPDAIVVSNLAAAIAEAEKVAAATGASEIMVLGGGEIYLAALPLADRVYLTRLAADIDGDTHFPDLPDADWTITSRAPLPRTPKDDGDAETLVYQRRAMPGA